MFKNLIENPESITILSVFCIISYIIVSGFFISNKEKGKGAFKKYGFWDLITSIFWILCAIILIVSLFYLCTVKFSMPLKYLVTYYFLFIFLFAIIYGIIDWHFPGDAFEGITSGSWTAELQYLILSIQTQSTIGYTNRKPKSVGIELLAAIHSLLGIFFMAIFISISINKLSGN